MTSVEAERRKRRESEQQATSDVAALTKTADVAAATAAQQFSQLAALAQHVSAETVEQADMQLSQLNWKNEELNASLRAANDEVNRLMIVEERLKALLSGEQMVAHAEGAARAQLEAEAERREAEIAQLRAQEKRLGDGLSTERAARVDERAAAAEAVAMERVASAAAYEASANAELASLRHSEVSTTLRQQLAHVTALLSVRDDELRRERAARASDACSHVALLDMERSSALREATAMAREDAQEMACSALGEATAMAQETARETAQPGVPLAAYDEQPYQAGDAPQDQPHAESSEEGDESGRDGDGSSSSGGGEGEGKGEGDTAEALAQATRDRERSQQLKLAQEDDRLRLQLGLPQSPSRNR